MSSNGSLVPTLASGPPPLPDSAAPLPGPAAHSHEPEAAAQPTPFKRIHQLLRGRYHWAILLAILLGAGGGVGGYFIKKPAYESVANINIRSTLDKIIYDLEGNRPPPDFDARVTREIKAMTSPRVLELALSSTLVRPYGLGTSTTVVNDLAEAIVIKKESREMVRIGYEDHDPERASAIVKSIVAAYMDIYGEREKKDQDRLMRELTTRQTTYEAELEQLRERKTALETELGSLDIVREFELRRTTLYDLQVQIKQVESALAERGVKSEAMALPKDYGEMTIEEMADADPALLGKLLAIQNQLNAEMDHLRGMGYGEAYRGVRSKQLEIDNNNAEIVRRIAQLKAGATTTPQFDMGPPGMLNPLTIKLRTTDELQRLLAKLREDEAGAEQALFDANKQKNRIDRVNEEINTTNTQLRDVRDRITKLSSEHGPDQERVVVLVDGTLPTKPSNGGKRKQLAVLGGMAGACMGVSIVLLIGLTDPRLRTIDDARSGLNQTRMLGILPSLPEDLADPTQASIAAHCVHHIRTMLQVGVAPEQRRVYSVTSPGAGTGKTSLTLALGLSFSASDSKTLLIDCDLVGSGLTRRVAAVVRRRIGHLLQKHGLVTPQQIEEALHFAQTHQTRLGEALIELGHIKADELNRVLNLQEQSLLGVMDACNGEPFDNCIAETGVKNLYILPTGTAMARHAASLSPTAVSRLVANARARFDTVLIDTGPILGSLEASVVAGTVDGTVLIVSRGDHRTIVDKSVEYLNSIRANILGVVFNRAEVRDFERSSFTSLASMTSLRGDNEIVEGEVIDTEASARLGPVGSAVATNSRIARNGSNHRT